MAAYVDKIAVQIQKIPTKARLIGFGALIIMLGLGFIYFFHIPMSDQIKQLEKDISALHATIKSNDEKINKLADLKAEVKALEDKLKLLTEQLPPGSEVSGLLRQIQNLVSQSGLSLKLWRPDRRKTHASGLYEEIPINMDLAGSYHDLGMFLDRVSKMTRIVNMLNLKMGGATMNKAGSIEIRTSCTALTFAAVEKKADAATGVKKTK